MITPPYSSPEIEADVGTTVAVFVVTYRRHVMLRRALASVLAQSHRDIVVKVVNDDPEDGEVARIVAEQGDARVTLYQPLMKRGATRNFNLMFEEEGVPFVSLLEDDNWWEPTFLEEMLAALIGSPHNLIVGNERIWRELPDGAWEDTGRTIFNFSEVRVSRLRIEDICGSARLCNSAMLVRVRVGHDLRTPDTIPVDVTEHFRERLLDKEALLMGRPLVNYAETLATARSTRGDQWGALQYILIGSVFAALREPSARAELAQRLWSECPSPTSPRAVSLVGAGLAIAEARALLVAAPAVAVARFVASLAKSPTKIGSLLRCRRTYGRELDFLSRAPLTRVLAGEIDVTRT